MNEENKKRILEAFGHPTALGGKLVFARQTQDDVYNIENSPTEELIKEWKGLVWMNHIYGQVSLNEMQRISLIECEFDARIKDRRMPKEKRKELRSWFDKAEAEQKKADEIEMKKYEEENKKFEEQNKEEL